MKYIQLNDDEEEYLVEYEKGRLVPVDKVTLAKKQYHLYVLATQNKSRNINIRLSEKDLHKLKVRAAEVGLPYQTLISSVLHQFASNKDTIEVGTDQYD
jgi:predicted DNA binding CopG/RHH family protein